MATETEPTDQSVAAAITEVSERLTLLVREEIELAKAEVSAKVSRLIRGIVIAIAAGIFVVAAMLLALNGTAWLAWYALPVGYSKYFIGFYVVAGGLLVLALLAGLVAARAIRKSSPPTPQMAIDEAKLIRETVSGRAELP